MCRVPVIREFGRLVRIVAAPMLERPGERRMEAGPFAREQVVVDGLLDQRVAERVALHAGRRVGDEDLALDALAQGVVQGAFIDGERLSEQRRVDALTGRRGHAQELLGGLGQIGDTGQEHVAERRRQVRPPIVARGDEQLLGEERVAVGTSVDRGDQPGIKLDAQRSPGAAPRPRRGRVA